MSTNVSLFDFNGHNVRLREVEGNYVFIALDVCRVLEVCIQRKTGKPNVTMALKNVAADEKGITKVYTPTPKCPDFHTGMAYVTESGLYKLVMRSNVPQAKRFQDWITKTVLPSIRKDGGYVAGEEMVATGEMSEDEMVLKALTVMQSKMVEAR